jgi:hypothetical protein
MQLMTVTLSITTGSLTAFGILTFNQITLSMTTVIILTLSIKVDLGEKYFHSVNCRRDKCRYAKCRGTTTAALSSQYLFTLSVATGRF